jgi:hypothetical protein
MRVRSYVQMVSIGTAVAAACLCIGILMQLLGVPTTLWELTLDFDPGKTASPEGFTILSTVPGFFPTDLGPLVEEIPQRFARRMFDLSVFRPPCMTM